MLDCGVWRQPAGVALKGWVDICPPFAGGAFTIPEIFILSHNHTDHYNGFVEAARRSALGVGGLRNIYYPGIPHFRRDPSLRKELIQVLYCMTDYYLGEMSGLPDWDLRYWASKLSRGFIQMTPLFRGDRFALGVEVNEVRWPPRYITHPGLTKKAVAAIGAFRDALGEDQELRNLYYEFYRDIDDFHLEPRGVESRHREGGESLSLEKRDIPLKTRQANRRLREVANSLSLCFGCNNDFLFFGDLSPSIINFVVKSDFSSRIRLNTVIASHHGTKFGQGLYNIRCDACVASVGEHLLKHIDLRYKDISDKFYATYINGTIQIH